MRTGHLIGAYIFGSVARGEHDEQSDLDILAIVQTRGGKVAELDVTSLVPPNLKGLKPSISWYGTERMREMFSNGELFAWHLHRETRKLSDPTGFLTGLGTPKNYMDCLVDVASFRNVLSGIPEQIRASGANAIYEAGLIYVCLRNIAMSASWHLCDAPDFSRYSPFRLRRMRACPISSYEYELTMKCRMASQRGNPPPAEIDRGFVISMFDRLDPWLSDLQDKLRLEIEHGRNH